MSQINQAKVTFKQFLFRFGIAFAVGAVWVAAMVTWGPSLNGQSTGENRSFVRPMNEDPKASELVELEQTLMLSVRSRRLAPKSTKSSKSKGKDGSKGKGKSKGYTPAPSRAPSASPTTTPPTPIPTYTPPSMAPTCEECAGMDETCECLIFEPTASPTCEECLGMFGDCECDTPKPTGFPTFFE